MSMFLSSKVSTLLGQIKNERTMGPKSFRFMLFLAVLSGALAGCRKTIFDFRTKYVGDYVLTAKRHTWIGGVGHDTTYSFVGQVAYGAGADKLIIPVEPSYSIPCVLMEDGSLTGATGSPVYGEFTTSQSLVFHMTNAFLGAGTTWDVQGSRR